MSNALKAVSGEVTDATKQKVSIAGLELSEVLRHVLTQIEIELQDAILLIRTELKHDDSDALQIFAACWAVLHSAAVEARRSLPNTADSIVDFDADIAAADPEQTEDALSS